MKRIIISLILLIAGIALLIAGLELFSSYKPSVAINSNAPVQTTKMIIINTSPEKIWTTMSRVNQWTEWHKDVQSPKMIGAFRTGNSFRLEIGLTNHSFNYSYG